MDELKAYLEQQFDVIHQKLDKVMVEMDQRFDKVDERFVEIDQRFDKVDERFVEMDQRFDKVDERFVEIDQRFEGLDTKVEHLNIAVKLIHGDLLGTKNQMNDRFNELNNKLEHGLKDARLKTTDNQGLIVQIRQIDRRNKSIEMDLDSTISRVERIEQELAKS